GVALDGGDVIDVGAQHICSQLHDRRLEAVAGRPAVHVDVDLAGRLHPDRRTLGREVPGRRSGRLDVRREANSEVAALFQGFALFTTETFEVKDFHRLLQGVRGSD